MTEDVVRLHWKVGRYFSVFLILSLAALNFYCLYAWLDYMSQSFSLLSGWLSTAGGIASVAGHFIVRSTEIYAILVVAVTILFALMACFSKYNHLSLALWLLPVIYTALILPDMEIAFHHVKTHNATEIQANSAAGHADTFDDWSQKVHF